MTDYKLVPVEPTDDMATAAMNAETTANMLYGEPAAFSDIWNAMLAAAPAVQGEPVGWVNSDELDNMLDDRTATLFPVRTGFHGKPVYAAPQPAEQQPDVTQLVEHQSPSSYPVSGSVYFRESTGEWVLEITASINGAEITARHTQPGTRPEDVIGLPALYESTPDITQLVEAASAALDEIEKIMHEAYNSAEPVCCGRWGSECCGSPEPEWSEHDQNTMDRLAPHQRALTAALAAHRKQGGEV